MIRGSAKEPLGAVSERVGGETYLTCLPWADEIGRRVGEVEDIGRQQAVVLTTGSKPTLTLPLCAPELPLGFSEPSQSPSGFEADKAHKEERVTTVEQKLERQQEVLRSPPGASVASSHPFIMH